MNQQTEPADETITERRVLSMMRKVLSAVARDTAPMPGRRSPLSDQTVEDIKSCMVVISMREQELAEAKGKFHQLRPEYKDQQKKSKFVSLDPDKK